MTTMITPTPGAGPSALRAAVAGWKSWHLRVCPAVRRGLKADAALAGVSTEERLHALLTEHLTRRGLLPAAGDAPEGAGGPR